MPDQPVAAANTYNVPVQMWQKWNELARTLFNGTYEGVVRMGQGGVLLPLTVERNLSNDEFATIAWNSAVVAAFKANSLRF